jgi:long-chain acyl-CoA synthetase
MDRRDHLLPGLAVPDVDAVLDLGPDCRGSPPPPTTPARSAGSNEAVRAAIQGAIDQANTPVSKAESIRSFLILDADFTDESGHLRHPEA